MASEMITKLVARYGESEHGNFAVVDTIGVPHPYMIGPRHVEYGSKFRGGILNESAIEGAERSGAKCCQRGCTLRWRDHKHALLVSCAAPMIAEDGKGAPELHAYLLKVKDMCEEDKYVGFAFIEHTLEQRKLAIANG